MSITTKPVVDFRTYTMRRGGVPLFLQLTQKHVLPVHARHIGQPLGYFATDIGPQDEVMHLWAYEGLGDMEARRRARDHDPEWPSYAVASKGLIEKQETRVVRRADFAQVDALPAPDPGKAVVGFRTTSLRRGVMPEFRRLMESLALPAQIRHFGAPVALYVSEVGLQNEFIQLWAFDSLADLETRRAARDREPAWTEFLAATESMVMAETTKVTRRVQFAG